MTVWKVQLIENEHKHQAIMYREGDMEALLDFRSLEGMLEWLSIQPRNRVKLMNPEWLQTLGVPVILKEGRISRTETVRALFRRSSPPEIAKATGIPVQTVSEIIARDKARIKR